MEGSGTKGNIGQMALVGDVWYQVLDKRKGINELTGYKGIEYLLYTKNSWIPESWVKDIKERK